MRSPSAVLRADDGPAPLDLTSEFAIEPVRSPPAAALDYSLITTREGFDGLAAAWEELFQRSGRGAQAFQTFGWCWQWCNHYLADKDTLAVVAGWRGSELVLVWPLVARRTAGVLKLTSLGAPVSQYSDALIEPSADVEAQIEKAWDFVVGAVKPDLVWLSHVRADAAIAPLMEQLGAIETQRLEAPYIDLSKTPNVDTFMRRYSSHTRKKYRAAGRRIADVGRFVELSEGTGARQLAASVIEMKRRQLRERGLLSPAFADNRMRDFFADAASGQGYPTGTRIQALQIGEECAAADIVLTCKQTVLGHVFTYDPRFAKDNVGLQLLHHIIDGLIGDGYQTFDLLAPADVYKLRCADGTVAVVDWAIPLTSKGRLLARAQKVARSAAKAALRWLPEEPRRYLAQRYYRRVS